MHEKYRTGQILVMQARVYSVTLYRASSYFTCANGQLFLKADLQPATCVLIRLKALAIRLEAIASRLETIPVRLEAIAIRLEAITIDWRPSLLD